MKKVPYTLASTGDINWNVVIRILSTILTDGSITINKERVLSSPGILNRMPNGVKRSIHRLRDFAKIHLTNTNNRDTFKELAIQHGYELSFTQTIKGYHHHIEIKTDKGIIKFKTVRTNNVQTTRV